MLFENNLLEEMKDTQKYLNNFFKKFEESEIFNIDKKFEDYRRALVNYKENDNQFILSVELPGIEKKDIKLDIDKNTITIKAEKKKEKEEGSKKKGDYKYEKSYAGFYQETTLPKNAKLEDMQTSYNDGVLKITIPKDKTISTKKRIEIK